MRTAAHVAAELKIIASMDDQTIAIGQLLVELRALSDGQFPALLRDIRPEVARPDAWADRMIATFRAACPSQPGRAGIPLAPGPPGLVPEGDLPSPIQEAPPPAAAPGRSASKSALSALDSRAARLYARLRPLLDLSPAERSRRLPEVAADLGLGKSAVYNALGRIRATGATGAVALNRKPRADRGRPQVSPEARTAFLQRRTDPLTRQELLQVSIRHVQREFPGEQISDYSLRRLQRAIPKALLMQDREWRAAYGPLGQWEVPHVNHTQVFDMTDADLFVWDRDDRPPYRPKLTALIDEHTQCCLGGAYTRETPSMAVLQALLLHGWLPKADPRWPMYGIPLHLHCDNGKVQTSHWLQAVCDTIGSDLRDRSDTRIIEGVRHAQVRSPWQDGHIENFYGIVHTHFECHVFPAAYCGRDPQHRREGFKGSLGGPNDWAAYPTLAQLNAALPTWLISDYHQLHHSRLKMTRLDAWALGAPGHVNLADRDYLYHALLQRAQCQIRRGQIHLNNQTYWHELLQGFEGCRLAVRWDPMDLGQVCVIDSNGQSTLCWAQRQQARNIDNPKHLAEHRQQKAAVKRMRGVLHDALQIAPLMDSGEFTQHVAAMAEARTQPGITTFPERVKPKSPPAQISADELLDLTSQCHSERSEESRLSDSDSPQPLELYGIEVR